MKPNAKKVEVVKITLDMVAARKCGNESEREAKLLYFLTEGVNNLEGLPPNRSVFAIRGVNNPSATVTNPKGETHED